MSWQVKPLREVCEFGRGLTYAKSDEVVQSDSVVLRANNIDLTTNQLDLTELRHIRQEVPVPESKKVKPGSLIVCTASGSKSHLGKVALVDRDYGYAFGGFMGQITPKNGLIPKYLFHLMTSKRYKDFIDGLSDGANINNLKFDDLGAFDVPFPGRGEQQRIVEILDEAFAGIATAKANAEKNLQNARAAFVQCLLDVFSSNAENYQQKTVAEVARHSLGKMLDKSKNRGELQPYLRNLNVRWFEFDLSDVLEMKFLPEEVAKYTAVQGDVLVCEGGYPGRAAIWEGKAPIHFQKALHRVRFHEPIHAKLFVYYLYAKDQSGELKSSFSGTGIQHFTGEAIAKFTMPIPPAKKISESVALFEALKCEVQRLESLYTRKLAALDELKQSLLHQAFSGQL